MKTRHDLLDSIYGSDKPKSGKRTNWKRILALFRPYWKAQLFALVTILLVALLGLVPGYATAYIIDSALPHRNFLQLLIGVLAIMVAALVTMALGVAQGRQTSIVGEGIMRDVRIGLVAHLHRAPLAFFSTTKTGAIMNRVSNDVDSINSVVTGTLSTIISNAAIITTTLAFMFAWNWRLALISLIVVPLMVLPLKSVGRAMYTIRKKTREQRDTIESLVQETLSISGITLIKSFARETFEQARFYEVVTQLMRMEIRLTMVGRWFGAAVGAMVLIGPALLWLGGGWLALKGSAEIGVIVAFVGYVQGRLYGPAASLVGIQAQVVSALAVFERVFEYMDLPTEQYSAAGSTSLKQHRGDVQFEAVAFSYASNREILRDISFVVPSGKIAAIVGPSGAGKSTITNLIPRFYDPQRGRILIGGHDIRDLPLESLRRDIGIVTQETYLFHDTIANNLRYAKPEATNDDLAAAAAAANIHEFILGLPDGYDTIVGERGHKLSGGERQRLAIARVLLKDPIILILDEATSALDAHNEVAIQSALEIAMRGRTSFVIAHRFSTILSADVIVVIENGVVVQTGTHDSLLVSGGVYASLYRAQFRDA